MAGGAIRLDKWLWQARFVKTRPLAVKLIESGHVRLNGQPCRKPGRTLSPGAVLTLRLPSGVRVIEVVAPGTRRGPAAEATTLYRELAEPAARSLD